LSAGPFPWLGHFTVSYSKLLLSGGAPALSVGRRLISRFPRASWTEQLGVSAELTALGVRTARPTQIRWGERDSRRFG
jgi:hypothetical protein